MKRDLLIKFSVVLLSLVLAAPTQATVSLGIDELENSHFAVLQGKRVGLITNPSGADSHGRSAIDVLHEGEGFKLVRLFGPEHGIDGQSKAGDAVENERDRRTGLMVYSLYGDTRRPTPEMLKGIDTLVYDVQDLGCRSYTFISTLGYIMEEASKHNIEVVVLDRPNPLGGLRLEGPRRSEQVKSFIGLYDIPYVYGLTPGELAEWINVKYLDKPCHLTVVKMKGWSRNMVWEDTQLKWIPTSPNIPTIGAARGYVATGFLGEIGLENGVGGPRPFQTLAAPRWNMDSFCARFNKLHILGVKAVPYSYETIHGRWRGTENNGIYLSIDPWVAGNLTSISFYALELFQKFVDDFTPFHGTTSDQRSMFDKITGIPTLRRQISEGIETEKIIHSWDAGVSRWGQERQPFLLYGNTLDQSALADTTPAVH